MKKFKSISGGDFMFKSCLYGISAIFAMSFSLSAFAMPISFDFTGSDSDDEFLTMYDRMDLGNEHIGNVTDGLVFTKPLVGGLTLTVKGTEVDGTGATVGAEVILDDSPDEGGLGVVSEGSSSLEQVNTTAGETLILNFSEVVSLSMLDFNSGAHNNCPDTGGSEGACGMFDLTVDGLFKGTFNALDFVDISNHLGSTFALTATTSGAATAFYLGGFDATVPAPTVLGLLSIGLLGVGAATKRRNKMQ